MDKDKLILEIMKEAEADGEPLTREEAEEVAEMEIKAKGNKRYEKAVTATSAKKTRERKVDEDNKAILSALVETLAKLGYESTMETEVALHFGEYSLKLTKHRPPKK